jgi:GT2 family glycosyltransferase
MNATRPRLSIVILTHNRSLLLRDCLRTLAKQDAPPESIELLIADDGSTDDTRQVAEQFSKLRPGIRHLFQPHRGIPAARNLGVRNAVGEFIAIVADDYLLAKDYGSTVLRFFDENPEAEVVRFRIVAAQHDWSSRLSQFYYDINLLDRLVPPPEQTLPRLSWYLRRIAVPKQGISTDHDLEAAGAAAFRASVFQRVGFFDESLLRGEDTDYTRRLKAQGIGVYYNPFHRVCHQYDKGCLDTLHKCFKHGTLRFRLRSKYTAASPVSKGPDGAAVAFLFDMVRSLWLIRQTLGTWRHLAYLPGVLAFEASLKAGLCWGYLTSCLGRSRRPAPDSGR